MPLGLELGAGEFLAGLIPILMLLFISPLIVIPPGLALWVAIRHLRGGRRWAGAAYAIVPIVGAGVFMGSYEASYHAGRIIHREFQLASVMRQVEAVRVSGKAVNSTGVWIDPGPPLRGKFETSTFFMINDYILYDEADDSPWLEAEAHRCRSEIRRLREHLFRIVGKC